MNGFQRRIFGATLAAALMAPSTSSAQLRATLDAGGANVRYADTLSVIAKTLSPTISYDGDALRASAMGVVSSLDDASRSMQGAVALSMLSPAIGSARFELGGDAGGTTHQDGTRTGRYLARARLPAGIATAGMWLSGAAGHTWDGSLWHRVAEGDLGVWMRSGRFSVLGIVSPAAVGDSIRYTDGQAIIRWDALRAELQAGAGFRGGDALVQGPSNSWGSVAATFWLFPQVGLVASGGSYPMDLTQGFPGGRYVSAAIRIAAQPRRVAGQSGGHTPLERGAVSTENRLTISARSDGKRVLRLHAPRAGRVEVMGDLTNWAPVALERATAGWWTVVLPIGPGAYQINVRHDGGAWAVPAGLPAVEDEFGTKVGVVHVR